MSDPDQVERLTLLGEELPVRVSEEDDLARQAVKLVREKLDSVGEGSGSPSDLQAALLSSLNLAGDLVRKRRKDRKQHLSEDTTDRVRNLTERIDELLARE